MLEHSLTLPLGFRAAEKVGHCLTAARVGEFVVGVRDRKIVISGWASTTVLFNNRHPATQRVNAFPAFEFRHGSADPLLEVVAAEPLLYTMRNPDRVTVDGGVGRPVLFAPHIDDDSSSLNNFLQVATLNEHVQMASSSQTPGDG
jgi:hypothetical protein